MTFKTVFDASQQGYETAWFPAFGLIFVAIGAMLVFRPALMQQILPGGLQGKPRKVFSWIFFSFALLWTTIAFLGTLAEYQGVASDLREGRFSVVEGPVTDFVPMPYGGHALESFKVNGRQFSYSDYVVTSAFHNTASHGGPIREGLYVRISYSGNLILRLEVDQENPGPMSGKAGDEAVIDRAQSEPYFFAAWVSAAIAGYFLFVRGSDAAFKRKWFPWYIVLVGACFAGFVLLPEHLTVTEFKADPWLFVPLLAIGVICYVNIRVTKFCDHCGSVTFPAGGFTPPKNCSKCGRPLA